MGFTPPPLFGPPRTRAAALAYAKKAVYKKADKDQQPETTQVHHQVQPHKGPRHSRWSGRVEMSIDTLSSWSANTRTDVRWTALWTRSGTLRVAAAALVVKGALRTCPPR